jgi:hypothetical protein
MVAARARAARLSGSWKAAASAAAFFCRGHNRDAESQRPIWSVDRQFQIRFRIVAKMRLVPSKSGIRHGISPKIVVGMQHRPTTSFGNVKTPKKAAVACLFSFPQRMLRRRLVRGNWLQSIVAVLGAFEVGLILQRWGSS